MKKLKKNYLLQPQVCVPHCPPHSKLQVFGPQTGTGASSSTSALSSKIAAETKTMPSNKSAANTRLIIFFSIFLPPPVLFI